METKFRGSEHYVASRELMETVNIAVHNCSHWADAGS